MKSRSERARQRNRSKTTFRDRILICHPRNVTAQYSIQLTNGGFIQLFFIEIIQYMYVCMARINTIRGRI